MGNKRMLVNVSCVFLLSFILIYLGLSKATLTVSSKSGTDLDVKISSFKQEYVQGEMVNLNFEVHNNSSSDISLKGANTDSGYLKVYIASADQKFKVYSNSAWGRKKTKGVILKAGKSIKSHSPLLWNYTPKVSQLNAVAAKLASEDRIMSDYAFSEPGVYLIKAVLIIPGETPTKIEFEPVQIVISAPSGDDLDVWKQMKVNGDIAYFIQQGETPTHEDEKAGKLIKEIEQISEKYSGSFLSNQMKQSLEKFRVDKRKIDEALEKARIKPSN